eukprot:763935-Hanusia_phi.AAC.5
MAVWGETGAKGTRGRGGGGGGGGGGVGLGSGRGSSMQLSSGTRKLLDDMMKDAGLNHRKATELRQVSEWCTLAAGRAEDQPLADLISQQFVDFNGSLPVARPAVDVDQLASTLPVRFLWLQHRRSLVAEQAKPRVLNPKNFRGGRKTASAIAQEVRNPVLHGAAGRMEELNQQAGVPGHREKPSPAFLKAYEGDIPVVKPVQELRTRTKRYVPPGVRTAASAKSETEVLQ